MTRKAEAMPRSAKRPLRDRTLAHYPPPRTRMTCLGIVVLATVGPVPSAHLHPARSRHRGGAGPRSPSSPGSPR